MRCKNCGWENPENSLRCEKCNAPLTGSMVDHGNSFDAPPMHVQSESPLKGTVKESDIFPSHNHVSSDPVNQKGSGGYTADAQSVCTRCGYPTRPDMNVCPSCGTPLKKGQDSAIVHENAQKKCLKCGSSLLDNVNFCPNCGAPRRMGTVNNWINPLQGVFCTLTPVAWANEGIDYQPISYSGDTIVLNRANTDPNNNSITSKEQAVLTHDGSDWYIENRSEQETTFIKVRKKTKLESGDVIILGNRMFEFKG